jgi:hypothetical protein
MQGKYILERHPGVAVHRTRLHLNSDDLAMLGQNLVHGLSPTAPGQTQNFNLKLLVMCPVFWGVTTCDWLVLWCLDGRWCEDTRVEVSR